MKHANRTLALALSFIMALMLLPMAALAETVADNPEGVTVDTLAAGDTMENNNGDIIECRGTLTNNYGRLQRLGGTITNNFGYCGYLLGGSVINNYGTALIMIGTITNDYYEITLLGGEHASATGLSTVNGKQYVLRGGSFTVAPDAGYIFAAAPTADKTDTTVTANGGGTYTIGVPEATTGSGYTATITLDTIADGVERGMRVTPGDIVFIEKGEGYDPISPRTYTVMNTGTQSVSNLSVTLSGPDAGSFTLSTATTLSALTNRLDTTTFTVKPNDGMPIGTYSAVINVSADSISTVQQTVSFEVAAPRTAISASPDAWDFGTRQHNGLTVNATLDDEITVTLTNTGNQSVTVTLPSDDVYTITAVSGFSGNSATLAEQGDTAAFSVKPLFIAGPGYYDKTLTVSGTGGASAGIALKLNILSGLVYTPAALDFGSVSAGYAQPAARTVTVTRKTNDVAAMLKLPTSTSFVILPGDGFGGSADGSVQGSLNSALANSVTFTVQPKAGLPVGVYDETIALKYDLHTEYYNVKFTVTDPAPASDPYTVTVNAGERASMRLSADPDAAGYQWYIDRGDGKGFVAISGATGESYTTSEVNAGNNGYRYRRATKYGGYSVDGNVFTLYVIGGGTVTVPDTGSAAWPVLTVCAALACAGVLLRRKRKA